MKRKTIIIIGAIVLLAVIAVLIFRRVGAQEFKYNTTHLTETTIENSVTATGYVQPVDQVEVGTQVSGVIEKIYVDYNSQVKKGQLLAELDKSTLQERVTQARASLISAQSGLLYAQQSYDREKQLFDVKAATQASFDLAQNQLVQAKSSVENANADLHQAQVNFSYAEIYSPIDGVVLERAVEQGQTVAASFSTPTLFTIANDLTNMQVEADVDEADIGQVRLGQRVTFTVDAFPDDIFEGTVNQIRLQPTVTNNVVTYTVIVEAPNPEEKLYPGMTASITIITYSETGRAILNEALKFEPTDEMFDKMPVLLHEAEEVRPGSTGVWVKTPEGMYRKNIQAGTSDGVYTIVESGLDPDDEVILSVVKEKKSNKNGDAVSNPLMPGPPRRR